MYGFKSRFPHQQKEQTIRFALFVYKEMGLEVGRKLRSNLSALKEWNTRRTQGPNSPGDCLSARPPRAEGLFPASEKKHLPLQSYSKGQFCKNTAYLERGMPYFAFVSTNAVLAGGKIDKL